MSIGFADRLKFIRNGLGKLNSADWLLIIAAVGTVAVNIINAWRIERKVDETLVTAAVIKGHVNSKETKYVEQLVSLQKENELLRQIIVEKDKDKALLAQATVMRHRSTDPERIIEPSIFIEEMKEIG